MLDNVFWAQGNNVFLVLPLFALGLVLLSRQLFWSKKIMLLLAGQKYLSNLFIGFSINKKIFKLILLSIGLLMSLFALLRPQWSEENQVVAQRARDLIIAVDISKSMLAQDLKPNRLEFAKNKIRKLIGKLNSERIGLIIFSGQAFCQCPLTSDIESIFTFLDAIDTESISSGATSLQAPILKAVEIFNNIGKDKKSKLLVIFTDGEDFSKNLSNVKEKAKDLNLKVFTLGIGTQTGSPIPMFDYRGHIKDYQRDKKNNQIVISRLNETVLNNLSSETGAQYIKATENDFDIDILVKKVNGFEKDSIEDKKTNSYQEKYYYFSILGLICLLIEWLV